MKLVSVAEMQAIERQADASGLSYAEMMENAGRGVAEQVQARYGGGGRRALALVGSGNNGGDALVALRLLADWGWQVAAALARPRPPDDPLVQRLVEAGGTVFAAPGAEGYAALEAELAQSDVLLDGVLGTGARLPLKPELAQTLGSVRQALARVPRPPKVVAVDCPSGVDCDSGEVAPETLPADLTVTMAAVKQGLLRLPAFAYIGALRVVSIGDLEGLPAWQAIRRQVVDAEWVRSILPPRPLDSHKGTFGTALVVAGCANYTGAALLAGKAAYRVGAGLVTLGIPESLHLALAGQFPEATWLLLPEELGVIAEAAAPLVHQQLGRATALLIGPGFGLERPTRDFVERLLEPEPLAGRSIGFLPGAARAEAERKPSARPALPPLVVDADGLKLLAQLPRWAERLPALSVLTPHPGEMATLTGLEKDALQADRLTTAERFASQWGHVVTLKGAFTVIAAPDGRSAVVPVATPALARAGTGDVLAGMIVGLRAQGVPAFEAAAAAAWLHAQAGLMAARRLGVPAAVLAGDVLEAIPAVLADLASGAEL